MVYHRSRVIPLADYSHKFPSSSLVILQNQRFSAILDLYLHLNGGNIHTENSGYAFSGKIQNYQKM